MALLTVQNLLLTLLALVAGASFVVQQAVNSNLRIELGSVWWAGFISYLGGAIVIWKTDSDPNMGPWTTQTFLPTTGLPAFAGAFDTR
jgi:transporter family-2 protein